MIYDIIVIGGGPAGLTAGIYASRALKKTLLIEAKLFGGQITEAQTVENYPGFTSISGLELGQKMHEQAKILGCEFLIDTVTKITKEKDLFKVSTNTKEYLSKTLIYGAGASPKKLGLKKEDNYLGAGLSYCATCDGAFFKNKIVSVIGGGNTALTDALYLANLCQKVYVIHRRDTFRGEPIKVKALEEKDNVEFLLNVTVKEIIGTNKIEKIKLENDQEVITDGVFVAIGHAPNTKLLEGFVSLNEQGYVLTNQNLETTTPGLFVIGDVREKTIRQLTTATSDGTIGALSACEYLENGFFSNKTE